MIVDCDFREILILGARASRPHKAWRSLASLPDLDQPATAPLLPLRLADAAPDSWDGMRAGRPRSQGLRSGRRPLDNPTGAQESVPCFPLV